MTAELADAVGADVAVPLHSRRRKRAQTAQKLQHLVPAAGLVFSGVQSLKSGAGGLELLLAVAGIITSALLIATFARSVRDMRAPASAHRPHSLDWMEIWAAGVLFAEAAERWHIRHRLPGPQLLTAVATMGIGLFHRQLSARAERRRSLRLTREHLFIGRNKFSHFEARWDEIEDIVVNEREATIRTHRGKTRRINLADLENAPAVREALQEAGRRLADHSRLRSARSAVGVTS